MVDTVMAIVGSNYGDEGKGHVVDWLTEKHTDDGDDVMVVRTNGGAQAGHTVVDPDETKDFVFHSYSSGTVAGADTGFSSYMIVTPRAVLEERAELNERGYEPKLFVDHYCRLNTPTDAILCQAFEEIRADDKHGSCGLGIGETMFRNDNGMTLAVRSWTSFTVPSMREHADRQIESALSRMGLELDALPMKYQDALADDGILEAFITDLRTLFSLDDVTIVSSNDSWINILGDYEALILEGAQGLGLDEEGEHFPHVTYSRTGSKNMSDLLDDWNLDDDVELYYATRCYVTRHGRGPLEHEGKLRGIIVNDPTNVDNKWQDRLRKAPLDISVTGRLIAEDVGKMFDYVSNVNVNFVVTCVDQVLTEFNISLDGSDEYTFVPKEYAAPVVAGSLWAVVETELASYIQSERLTFGKMYQGLGRTRDGIREIEEVAILDDITEEENA